MRSNSGIDSDRRSSAILDPEEIANFFLLRDSYKKISAKYLIFKRRPWYALKPLISKLHAFCPNASSVLDAGAGNGRNLAYFPNATVKTALDPIEQLVKHSVSFDGNPVLGSSTNLPFRNQSFDVVLSIAVIHHFRSKSTAKLVLKELLNMLRNEGVLLITVWRRDRPGRIGNVIRGIIEGKCVDEEYVPWKDSKGNIIAKRYYHYYTRKEFLRLLGSIPCEILEFGVFGGKAVKQNLFAIIRPLRDQRNE